MKPATDSDYNDPGFQIAPMVDVVFVLMLFFMACAGMQQKELKLSVDLPTRVGSEHVGIFIEINDDGAVTMNGKDYGTPADKELRGLRDWLRVVIEKSGDGNPVMIRGTPGARHERVMDVLTAVGAAGVVKVTFG